MINRTAIDRLTLPLVLLPLVKDQARVRHDRDDVLMTSHVAASIGLAERLCNVSLYPADYIVTADEIYSCQRLCATPTRWLLPLNNVRACVITGVDAADLSAGFTLSNADYGGNASSYLQSVGGATIPWDATLALTVGVDDPTELAPAFLSLISRMAASMYENREADADLWASGFSAELMALWRPFA
jgi:hypothetical protein